MKKEVICTGKTVEEALEKAYEELGVTSDQSDFEILERPKRSLFGFRVIPAKVRVFCEVPEAHPAVEPVPEKVLRNEILREERRKPQQRREPKREKEDLLETKAETVPEKAAPPKVLEFTETGKAKVECAVTYLSNIFREMGLSKVEIQTTPSENGAILTLAGDGLGVLIGRRGETLDALQYLAGLVANRLEGDYFRVTIDSGNYREKREHTLEQLARKLSNQVAKSGRSVTLEPMNPYERRIIHATVQTVEGVTSNSIGEEPNRRVVISSTNPRKRNAPRTKGGKLEGRNNKNSSHNRSGHGGHSRREASDGMKANGYQAPARRIDDSALEIEPPVRTQRPITQPVKAAKSDIPSDAQDKPLYSKIDLD